MPGKRLRQLFLYADRQAGHARQTKTGKGTPMKRLMIILLVVILVLAALIALSLGILHRNGNDTPNATTPSSSTEEPPIVDPDTGDIDTPLDEIP